MSVPSLLVGPVVGRGVAVVGGGAGVGVAAELTSDDAALEAFCRAQHRRLVGMVGLYCGDGDLAEELAQEALARLVRHWSRLPTEQDAARWLTRVALNLAKSSFRTRAGRRRIMDRYVASMVPSASSGESATTTALAVRAAVAQLPDRQRRVIVLRYFCDLPVSEVAAVMGCPPGTVKSLTSLAVGGLRRAGLELTDD